MFRTVFAALLALACIAAHAERTLPAELSLAEETAALSSAVSTGASIYRHDHAAAVATDAALALRRFKNDKRVRGWVTEEQGDQIVVTFLDATPAALYRVPVTGGAAGTVVALEAPTALSTTETGATTARSLALGSQFDPCSKSYNSVVLPGVTSAEDWVVYLLPGTTKRDLVPIGGAFRVGVKDSKVVSHRGFTRTCIALPSDPRAEALMVTHLLDSVPTEVHVFWSMWANKPIYVATPPAGTIWSVQGDGIRLVERKSGGG